MLTQVLKVFFGKWVYVYSKTEYERLLSEYSQHLISSKTRIADLENMNVKNEQKIAELEKKVQDIMFAAEEYKFHKHFSSTLIQLEKQLHNSDNADEILQVTFRTACEFYKADWAGFLELDMESELWWPFDWYTTEHIDMTKNYLGEFESTTIVPRWIEAMEKDESIVVSDRESIRDTNPEEYALYERVKMYAVIAVPVRPRPCGFLAVRNPKQYVSKPYAGMLQLLAFVALTNINDKAARKLRSMIYTPDDIKSENDVCVKLFGRFKFITATGMLTESNVGHSTTVSLLSFLAIRKKKKNLTYKLEDVFYHEKNDAKHNIHNMSSNARQDLDLIQKKDLLPKASAEEGYQFNLKYNIITDLDHFDIMFDELMKCGKSYRAYNLCISLVDLYEDDIQLDVNDEDIQFLIRDYHRKYFIVVDRLLKILNDCEDYNGMRTVIEKAMKIEADHPNLYYWLIVSCEKQDMRSGVRDYLKQARHVLDVDEFQEICRQLRKEGII